LKTNRNMMH